MNLLSPDPTLIPPARGQGFPAATPAGPSRSLTLLALPVLALNLSALDWPQWQGPDRNAISRETGLLQQWPKEGPPLTWKVTGLGGGDGAPAVAAGRILGMGQRPNAEGGEDEIVWALSETEGKTLWVTRLGPAHRQRMPQGKEGPGCTPTVDGDRLYVLGLGGELACLQVSDGKIVWQRNLPRDFGGQVPTWSYRESPLVDGDKLLCTPGGEAITLVALDKRTGQTLWKSQVPTRPTGSPGGSGGPAGPGARGGPGGLGRSQAAYASAIALDFDGQRQYVQFTARAVVGVAATDGKVLWQYPRPANGMGINCSTPIHFEGRVFASSAYGAGGGVVRLVRDEAGGVKAEEVWFSKRMQNHHGGVILHDGCLYGASGGNEGGGLVCLDFTNGQVLWDERDHPERRAPKGSVAFADGRLYYRTESGTVLLIEPSRQQYLERGRFEQPDRSDKPAWAHPVIANGKLYLRDQDRLLCYSIKR